MNKLAISIAAVAERDRLGTTDNDTQAAAVAELIEALREIAAMEEREGDILGTARSVARAALDRCRGGES